MRIACLQERLISPQTASSANATEQFAPHLGDVQNNLNRADLVLGKAKPQNLDFLVLPELAFSGHNFKSLKHISPFLEPTASGITSLWARTNALKYGCVVSVGYPEKVDSTHKWPVSPEYYNSTITVKSNGDTLANYRKSFLYYTDETWALEGADGFYDGEIDGLGNVAMGIFKWPTKSFERMDLNPYKFEPPWNAWEFAYHILYKQANLVVLSMAWLTQEDPRSYTQQAKEPDMESLSYWLARLEPVIREEQEGEIIVVLANRCGSEGEAVYAGTSTVLGIQGGEVKVYGILGRGEKELLVVDTDLPPQAKLVCDPSQPLESRNREASDPYSHKVKAAARPSTLSERRKKAGAPKLSIDTKSTEQFPCMATPGTPKAMEFTFDDIMNPTSIVSPVEPASPGHLFGGFIEVVSDLGSEDGSWISSTEQSQNAVFIEVFEPIDLRPDSPTLSHRNTPEHRCSSHKEILDHKELPLLSTIEMNITEAPNFAKPPTPTPTPPLMPTADMVDPIFERPASPKVRNCSRNRHGEEHEPPALMSCNPAQELQMTTRLTEGLLKTPQTSANRPRYQHSDQGLGPRYRHKPLPRPKSTVW